MVFIVILAHNHSLICELHSDVFITWSTKPMVAHLIVLFKLAVADETPQSTLEKC